MSETKLGYFSDLIAEQARRLGESPYILCGEDRISFAGFDRATCRAANGLRDHGAAPGDGIAILMGNCPEFLYLFYGVPRGGYYSVPVNAAALFLGERP